MKWLEASILFAASAGFFLLGPQAAAAQDPATAPDGQALYQEHCQKCHGPPGGAPPAAMLKLMDNLTSVTDPAFLATAPDDSLISVIETGRGKMKPLSEKLSKDEIIAIVRYLRLFETPADQEAPEPGEEP